MTVLITGSNGQLGKAFQFILRKKNINFIATGSEELDITNLYSIREFVQNDSSINLIINCAAYNNVDLSEKEEKKAYLLNSIAPKNLSIVASEINVPIVHYSTDYVFDGKKGSPYTIFDTPNPISIYGKSKYQGELMVQKHNTKHIIIRTSWLFGDGPVNFIKKVIKWSKETTNLHIVDDEVSVPTWANDLAYYSWELIMNKAYGTYHISNKGLCSRYEWASVILDAINWKGKIHPAKLTDFNLTAKRPGFSKLDNLGLELYINDKIQDWKKATRQYIQNLMEGSLKGD